MYYKDGIEKTADRTLYQPEVTKEEEPVPDELVAGREVYNTYCAPCHQRTARGTWMNPPLAGINIVTGNKTELVNIILKGFDKPTKINE